MTRPATDHAVDVSPFRTAWFEVSKLEPGVYLVSEPGHVNSWLIEGSTSAVLFDTGLGVANIRKVAEEITPRKLLVVNSHYHFDHTGGNRFFRIARRTTSIFTCLRQSE
ncbi:MAG: MBL fold metallo-hydrolase [Chloroflexi bacterium]|nr:MAG: MBL fold metallo-hydrolase [Chloroflexota bacterium]